MKQRVMTQSCNSELEITNKIVTNCSLIDGSQYIISYVDVNYYSINQSIKFISNQIKKFDIQCTLYNIHGKLFYNKHVATFSISD